ncbi:MAG: PIN domain nuclease [Candidatus Cloacimonetes bacterium]|nr:PIN domain nuclease [Candidatus Cloacimonadota bacterium]
MKKIRLYLDTSVISHLEAPDAPEKMQETIDLWEEIKNGQYKIYLSSVVFDELDDCHEPKRLMLYNFLEQIEYEQLEVNSAVREIANEIIRLDILKQKHLRDCFHIGCAIVSECDYIVSWNFKHMVNVKVVKGVRAITNLLDYKPIDLISPSMLINKEE